MQTNTRNNFYGYAKFSSYINPIVIASYNAKAKLRLPIANSTSLLHQVCHRERRWGFITNGYNESTSNNGGGASPLMARNLVRGSNAVQVSVKSCCYQSYMVYLIALLDSTRFSFSTSRTSMSFCWCKLSKSANINQK